MPSRKIGALLLFLCALGQLTAQDYDNFYFGKLVDSTSGEPVVFATVRVKGKALGVISNFDGGFKIPVDFQLKGEALVISSMGYKSRHIAFDSLKEKTINRIRLQQSAFELAETVVTAKRRKRRSNRVGGSLTAKRIIRYALDNIPHNYTNSPFELVGYYRDYQLRKGEYTNLNEALIKVFDQGFTVDDYQSIEFGLLDYKTNRSFKVDSFAAKPYDYGNWDKVVPYAVFGETYAPNELVLLFIHDAIRNHNIDAYSYVYKLVDDFIKEHRFSWVKNTSYGDQEVYQIEIRREEVPFQVKGTIYIDKGSFAIRKLDYAVYKQKLDDSEPIKYTTNEKELLYEIVVEYQKFNKKMYLNYISFHNQFKLIRPPRFFIEDVLLNSNNRGMKVSFNTSPANRLNDILVKYEGKRVKVRDIKSIDPSTFVIYFVENNQKQRELLNLLFSKIKDKQKSTLEIEAPQLVDNKGNRLGERKSEIYDQFREFFTQKINEVNEGFTQDSFLVKKEFSLGDVSQPKIEAGMDDDFWMNTPLKSIP